MTHQGSECYIACFQNVLRNSGIDIDETEIFFLGEGFATCYEKRSKGNVVDISIRSFVHESIETFCEKNNFKYEIYKDLDSSSAEKLINTCIHQDIPIIVKMDSGCIDYNAAFKNAFGLGLSHFVVVIDEFNDHFLVSDGFVPTVPATIYQGAFGREQFTRGRNARGNECIVFSKEHIAELSKSWNKKEATDQLINELAVSLALFISGEGNQRRTTAENTFYGVNALKALVQDLPLLPDYYGEQFTEHMLMLYKKIRMWGVMGSRFLLEKTIAKLSEEQHLFDEQVNNNVRLLIRSWNTLSLMLMKIGMSKRTGDLIPLAQKINELIETEVGLYSLILSHIKN
ncbi:BtrH N-terminal domain-containing protein [Paenibacillus borealis]|uniref:BtrH N-terminal domain-containing protein n=1 Tax=Paenibacillus borealis TaxID=160799 RepID=UPI000B213EC3|nr:BtrH N-terminal domain-containing protein [Paenibacillus borealis]